LKIYFILSQNFVNCSKFRAVALFLSSARKRNVVHVRHTFVCRAVDTFCVEQLTFLKKVSSEQSRFEQMHFEQFTLTCQYRATTYVQWSLIGGPKGGSSKKMIQKNSCLITKHKKDLRANAFSLHVCVALIPHISGKCEFQSQNHHRDIPGSRNGQRYPKIFLCISGICSGRLLLCSQHSRQA
jgi:hypothetical protein